MHFSITHKNIKSKTMSALFFFQSREHSVRWFNTKWPLGQDYASLSPCPIDSPPGFPRSVIWQNTIHASKIKLNLAGLSDEYGGDGMRWGERGECCRMSMMNRGRGERDSKSSGGCLVLLLLYCTFILNLKNPAKSFSHIQCNLVKLTLYWCLLKRRDITW